VATATARESAEGPFRLVELAGEADMTTPQLAGVLGADVAAGPPLLVVDLSRPDVHGLLGLHVILTAGRDLRAAAAVLATAMPDVTAWPRPGRWRARKPACRLP
jgi:hypothetical protein